MIKIIFESSTGETRTIKGEVGDSVMRTALANDIEEVKGECGGVLSCATCHVFVDPTFLPLLPLIDELEAEMLDGAMTERQTNSRLSCQLVLSAELDGMRIITPERQM